MEITITFALGLIIALVGVIPPGLLNMTAAKISIKDGYTRGLMFSIGVCIVVVIQTLIALLFASYLSSHPNITNILQRVAFVIFVLLTIYFLVLANKEEKPKIKPIIKSKKGRFFEGMLLSALNVFPIPYQAYMGTTLATAGLMTLNKTSIASYVSGAATGTFVMLYVYIFFFKRIKSKKVKSQKTINYTIGIITGIISIVTFINIIREW
ncbi:LysE family transporter [Lacinutrix sp. 5H-3-7-4]|uniref:LysE family transporter n=1 Tax=Lacinutrix sp. (strain 5H-3-7-4) TaxID=983544 RepID=UPI00020A39AB|nr:LysE family transporter [Lacinutrix sp. 5H-3-7-4]AEH01141.1 Lysine exporter protein (LYSE/YGGA) [Lacinutrix sp. 5H-3-7-4]